jgi:membrane protease YdiL (CAAX protease family)
VSAALGGRRGDVRRGDLPAIQGARACTNGIAPAPMAPPWHTALLIAVIVAVAATGTILRPSGAASRIAGGATARITEVYLPMVIVQWGLLLYVCRIGRPRSALGSLLGERWTTPRRAVVGVLLGLAGWLLVLASERAWALAFGPGAGASIVTLLPDTWPERAAWIVVSLSAGFCEEVVYRGYLQRQLAVLAGRTSVGILLQAALFGIAHGDQGPRATLRVAVYGLAFGALARWRRSLWPGIVCHAWTDFASGLLR